MAETRTIAVIGLGSMGYGIAQSCLRAGFETFGVDVRPDQMARLRAKVDARNAGLTLPGEGD